VGQGSNGADSSPHKPGAVPVLHAASRGSIRTTTSAALKADTNQRRWAVLAVAAIQFLVK
jgi:hypothetical protein